MFEKTMDKGVGFGELALIYNDKRSATIRALEECTCYVLDGVLFKKIIIQSSMKKRTQNAGFLNGIKLFDSLDKQQKLRLVDGLQAVTKQDAEEVFKQGDSGAEFYIVESGNVDCIIEEPGQEDKVVRTLNMGDHFGELALINNMPRSLTIKAKGETRLLMLDREAFTRILGSIEVHLKKDYK